MYTIYVLQSIVASFAAVINPGIHQIRIQKEVIIKIGCFLERSKAMVKGLKGLILVIGIAFLASACQTTPAQDGAMWGGAIGAVAGQIIGGDTEATLIGAGVGALGGAIVNDAVQDGKQKAREDAYNEGYRAGQAQSTTKGYTSTIQQQPQYNTAPSLNPV